MDALLVQTVKGLRELADFLEAKDVAVPGSLVVNLWPHTREEFLEAARKLGTCEKTEMGRYFVLKKRFSGVVFLELNADHELVCERVVHQRVVPATEERVVPAQPERVEEVVEWKCPDSVLSLSK